MKEEIIELLELQKVDLELDRIRLRKEEIPKEIESLKIELEQMEDRFDEFLKNLKELELKLSKKNVDLKAAEDLLKKYLNQLFELRSNEEYARMQRQIELQREKITSTEDEILDLMEEIEDLKMKRPKEEEDLKRIKENVRRRIKALERELMDLDDLILRLQDERTTRLKKVPRGLVPKYEKLRQLRGGSVVVHVLNGTCGGCHVALPIQVVNDLKVRRSFAVCENCGRLLYWSEENST